MEIKIGLRAEWERDSAKSEFYSSLGVWDRYGVVG